MKTTITKISLAFSALFILLSFRIDEIAVRFVIMGELPGTSVSLSPNAMFALLALIVLLPLGAIIFKVITTPAGSPSTKKHLPKRRYSPLS